MSSTADRRAKGEARQARSTQRGAVAARFRELNTFVDFVLRHLTNAEARCWLILWRDSREGLASTAQTDLAQRAGLAPRNVRRALERLKVKGLLVVVHQGGYRAGKSTYRVRALPPELEPETETGRPAE